MARPNVGEGFRIAEITPRDLLASEGNFKLYHYKPSCAEVYRVPVLFVTSPVKRPSILDLLPGQSLIGFLVERGFDVFLIEWGVPRREDHKLRLENFILERIPQCLDRVRSESGEEDVSVVGYHLGGMLVCMHAATHLQAPAKNLVCLATPANALGMVKTQTGTHRRPVDRLPNPVTDAYLRACSLLDRCFVEEIPWPRECERQFEAEILHGNRFVKNELRIGRRRVDLGRIRAPFLHVIALYDRLVPAAATKDLFGLIGSDDKTELVMRGDHQSLFAGGNAVYRLWPKLDGWLGARSR